MRKHSGAFAGQIDQESMKRRQKSCSRVKCKCQYSRSCFVPRTVTEGVSLYIVLVHADRHLSLPSHHHCPPFVSPDSNSQATAVVKTLDGCGNGNQKNMSKTRGWLEQGPVPDEIQGSIEAESTRHVFRGRSPRAFSPTPEKDPDAPALVGRDESRRKWTDQGSNGLETLLYLVCSHRT